MIAFHVMLGVGFIGLLVFVLVQNNELIALRETYISNEKWWTVRFTEANRQMEYFRAELLKHQVDHVLQENQ